MNDETVRTLLVIVNYIMPMIICTSLIIMLIINSFLIGNIRDKEENVDNIREYSLIRLLITGININSGNGININTKDYVVCDNAR